MNNSCKFKITKFKLLHKFLLLGSLMITDISSEKSVRSKFKFKLCKAIPLYIK